MSSCLFLSMDSMDQFFWNREVPQIQSQAAQFIDENVDCDFVDINCGCPLDEAAHSPRVAVLHVFSRAATN